MRCIFITTTIPQYLSTVAAMIVAASMIMVVVMMLLHICTITISIRSLEANNRLSRSTDDYSMRSASRSGSSTPFCNLLLSKPFSDSARTVTETLPAISARLAIALKAV